MKIAYIVPSLAKSGPIKIVHQLVEELSGEHKIEVFYFKVPENSELLKFDVPCRMIRFGEAIDFDKFDIVHSHSILPDSYIFRHRKRIRKTKTVTTLHNYAGKDLILTYGIIKGYLLVGMWNIVTSRHNKVIVLSQDAVKYYGKFWLNKNIDYVYNGILQPISHVKEKTETQNESIIKIGAIASAQGIHYLKGFDQIIKAIASDSLEKFTIYIAGKESTETTKLKMISQEYGVENRVKFIGHSSDMDLFIGSMDLFVLPSRTEGLPVAALEVARMKKALVCSDIPIFKEIFAQSEVSFFELEDIESLRRAITSAYKNRNEMSKKIYTKYIEKFTAVHMAKNYLNTYKQVLGE